MTKEPLVADQDKFVLRLPRGMRDRIKAAADGNNRSMNAEIIATLEEKYPDPGEFDLGTFLTMLSRAAGEAEYDMEAIGKLVREGNAVLEENGFGWRVVRSFDHIDGKTRLMIVDKSDLPEKK